MPILSNFVRIVGDDNITIGDGSNENGFTRSFRTTARRSDQSAYISFMVRGMTATNDNADIFVNDRRVGVLFRNTDGNPNHWQSQIVGLQGNALNDGENVLRVSSVPNPGSDTDDFDDFTIRSVYCHFHQDS